MFSKLLCSLSRRDIKPELPKEILHDILERLPLKTLMKFRCVSKYWCNLINSREFKDWHYKRSRDCDSGLNDILLVRSQSSDGYLFYVGFDPNNNTSSSPCYKFDIPPELRLPRSGTTNPTYPFKDRDMDTVGVCNGLVCISGGFPQVDMFKLALVNPITGDLRVLPSFGDIPISVIGPESWAAGFGYDSSTDDYKVVMYMTSPWDDEVDVEDKEEEDDDGEVPTVAVVVKVYSMRTNSWKTLVIEQDVFPPGATLLSHAAFLNDTLHWPLRTIFGSTGIATFHLPSEQIGYVIPPSIFPHYNEVHSMRILAGCLCLQLVSNDDTIRDSGDHRCHSSTLIMKEYGIPNPWTVLFSTLDDFYDRFKLSTFPLPVAYYPASGGEDFVIMKDFDTPDRLLKYNLKNAVLQEIELPYLPTMASPFVFKGSLVAILSCEATYEADENDQVKENCGDEQHQEWFNACEHQGSSRKRRTIGHELDKCVDNCTKKKEVRSQETSWKSLILQDKRNQEQSQGEAMSSRKSTKARQKFSCFWHGDYHCGTVVGLKFNLY